MIIFSGILYSESFASIPSGPIEINIENVTVTSPSSSSEESSGTENKHLGEAITQALSVIGATATATVGAIFAYIKRRQVPSTLEQEQLFNSIMKEAYYESYLPIWRKIWEIVGLQNNENDEKKFIDYLWKHYFGKRLIPTESGLEQMKDPNNLPANPPEPNTPDKAQNSLLSYAILKAKKFHLNSISKEENLMQEKLRYLFNQSDVKYYNYVTTNLPSTVERAVLSTDNLSTYRNSDNINKWRQNALDALKRLMIYSFMREDEKVLKILIEKEINKILAERSKAITLE